MKNYPCKNGVLSCIWMRGLWVVCVPIAIVDPVTESVRCRDHAEFERLQQALAGRSDFGHR
jgi:hypothetical protein